jgi:ADP-heptose:LPS heptosyltransferase
MPAYKINKERPRKIVFRPNLSYNFYLMAVLNFKKAPIYLACLRRFIIGRRAVAVPKNIRTVIVMQTAKMGDMVCTTPVFRAIKKFRPDVRLIVFGNKPSLETLENNADIDERIIIGDFKSLVNDITKCSADYACLMLPDFTTLAALYSAGVRTIVAPDIKRGISTGATRSYKILKKLVMTVPYYEGQYFARQYLRLLEPLGIKTSDTSKHLGFSKAAQNRIEEFLNCNDVVRGRDLIVGFSASAGNKIKIWPALYFAKVADYLFSKYRAKLFIIGGSRDKEENDAVMSLLNPETRVINCSEIFNVDELKAVISKLDLFFSVDTGPIYIAEAFDVPTIDIVGPMDEREQPPQGEFCRVVAARRKEAQMHIMNARGYNFQEARRQVEDISAEAVIREFDDLFLKLNKRKDLKTFA